MSGTAACGIAAGGGRCVPGPTLTGGGGGVATGITLAAEARAGPGATPYGGWLGCCAGGALEACAGGGGGVALGLAVGGLAVG